MKNLSALSLITCRIQSQYLFVALELSYGIPVLIILVQNFGAVLTFSSTPLHSSNHCDSLLLPGSQTSLTLCLRSAS